tara:strand:- start:2986 stop:3306 length:321 start_codon:yes stop_codon:yes gene_type:complete
MNNFKKLENLLFIFIIFSLLDFFFTAKFLKNPDFSEVNIFADFIYKNTGDLGLFVYKGIIIAIIIFLSIRIELYKENYGKHVLELACILTGGVVIYSATLFAIVYL